MTVDARDLAEATQLAAGVVAAKHRGDLPGAEELLGAFGSEAAATRGFLMLAEVALGLVRAQTGQSMDELVQELSLLIGATLDGPGQRRTPAPGSPRPQSAASARSRHFRLRLMTRSGVLPKKRAFRAAPTEWPVFSGPAGAGRVR